MTYIVLWGLKILVSIVSLHVFGLDFLMMTMPLGKYQLSETSFKKKSWHFQRCHTNTGASFAIWSFRI